MSFQYNLKRLLSFLFPIIVKKIESRYSGTLELTLHNGKLILDTAEANYSYGSLHDVFRSAVKELDFGSKNKSALILGFGAGSIATILNKEMKLNLQIDGVDLDPVVLDIYKEHFYFVEDNCSLIISDVIKYLEDCKKEYDYIFIDLFINLEVPINILSSEFVQLLQKCSKPNTSIIMNTMLTKEHAFVKTWKDTFRGKAFHKQYHADNLVLFKVPTPSSL